MLDPRGLFRILVWLSCVAAAPAVTWAQELPLWEAGVGVGVAYLPDYRGSDDYRSYLLPVPYFVYRGPRFRVDRRGARGQIFESDNVSINVSANLGPPAKSDTEARAGMPNLDPTVEIGPSLNFRLHENPAEDRLWSLRLPVRGVIATDLSHARYIGVVFLPNVAYDILNIGPGGGWSLGLSAGPIYASRRYHEYYYSVAPEFATPTRPAFDAPGGYSGASVGVTLSKRYPNYWIGGFIRYDNLHDTVFEESPLVRSTHAFFAGFAVSAILARSEKKVQGEPSATEP